MKRIKTAAPELPEESDDAPAPFVFDESDPAVLRLLAAGIPKERLMAADSSRGRTDE